MRWNVSRAEIEELMQAMTDETVRGERLAHGLLGALVILSLLIVWW